VGEIPVLGQLGDFVIKANERNYKLIEAHYFEGKHKGSGLGIIIGLLLFLLLFIVVMVYLFLKLLFLFYKILQNL
jgi:flagellar biogenesis protein FliO